MKQRVVDAMTARVAELEAERDGLERQLRQSQFYRGNALDEMRRWQATCAAMAEALKPLADMVIRPHPSDEYAGGRITSAHVRAARAALAMQTAPPTPG
jgi:hypothetical protein